MYNQIMLDIETFGNGPRAPIVAIAAVRFSLDEPDDEKAIDRDEFYCNVSLQSSLNAGMVIEGETTMWWIGQGEDVRRKLTYPPPIGLSSALEFLYTFVLSRSYTRDALVNEEKRQYKAISEGCPTIWSHSTFDPPVVRCAADCLDMGIPWGRRNTADIRTYLMLSERLGINPEDLKPKVGRTKHDALDDCKYQIRWIRSVDKAVRNLVQTPCLT